MFPKEILPPIKDILLEVEQEDYLAMAMHEPMNSVHEAYAIILEELEEFWQEVRKRKNKRDIRNMRKELIQIAAMAIRTIYDLQLPQAEETTNE